MFLFFVPSEKIPAILPIVIFAVVYPLSFFIGYFLGQKADRRKFLSFVIASLLVLGILFALTFKRAFFGGTYETFGYHEFDLLGFLKTNIGKYVFSVGTLFTLFVVFSITNDKKLKDFVRG